MARKKKKLKKIKRRLEPFLDRVGKHIAKIAENTSLKDIQDIILNLGLAYAGYEALRDWKGAVLGPVSLKLAQTQGGTPPIAQIAGVAGLSLIGVALLGQKTKYSVRIPGTEIDLPQAIPDPFKYVPEQLAREKPVEYYIQM